MDAQRNVTMSIKRGAMINQTRPRKDWLRRGAACAVSCMSLHADAGSLPNIIVMLTDDIGPGDISFLNPSSGFETPHIDALAVDGVVFRHGHSTAAVCAPSRYAVLTGNYVFRGREPTGVWTHCTPSQILPGQMTLAGLLRDHGYRSAFLGKLHMGAQFHRRDGGSEPARMLKEADLSRPMFDGPLDHGFDYSLVLTSGIQRGPYAFFENDRLARWELERGAFRYFDTDEEARRYLAFQPIGTVRSEDEIDRSWNDNYHMDNFDIAQVGPLLTHAALRFMEAHVADYPDRPFFIHFSSQAARHPWRPPVDLSPNDPNRYNQPGDYPVRGRTPTPRGDMVVESDQTIRALLERLEALGVRENTWIIYTSDNGAGHHMTAASYWDDPRYFNFKWGAFGGNRWDIVADRDGQIMNPQGITVDGRPLKGQKGDAYEGGHRVPLIVHGGKASGMPDAARGMIDDRLAGLHDFFATFCDLIGAPRPEGQAMDSISFADVLMGTLPTDGARRTHLMAEVARIPVPFEQAWATDMANERGWEKERNPAGYIVALMGPGAPDNKRISGMMESRHQARALYRDEADQRWKLIITADRREPGMEIEAWELYRLSDDPTESKNLIDEPAHQELIRSMLSDYRQLIATDPRYQTP